MQEYKHKSTGFIATETLSEKNYKVSDPKNFTIPKWIIENSNDWEKIIEKKPVFITNNGINIFEGDSFWYSNEHFELKYWSAPTMDTLSVNKAYLYNKPKFITQAQAIKYIEENKPQHSKKDMIEFGKKSFSLGCKLDYCYTIEELLDIYLKK